MALFPTLSRAALLTLGLVPVSVAHAQDAGVRGQWLIAKAVLAPWADPQQRDGPQEERRLVGRSVTFGAHSVVGPSPLGCAHAAFRTHEDTPDLLFEGELAEPDPKGRSRDPVALARGLGMTTRTVLTIETSCSEVAYHRFGRDTLVFGLNDRIYTLHPAPVATHP